MRNTLRFKSSVLFGTHTLLDKSFRVLQFPTHLSNLTANGYYNSFRRHCKAFDIFFAGINMFMAH